MLIYYCDTCGKRIPDEDVESGAANKAESGNYFCTKCSAPVAATSARATQNVPLPSGGHAPTTRSATRVAPRSLADSHKSGRVSDSNKSSVMNPVVILSAIGIGLMIAGVALTFSKKKVDDSDTIAATPAEKPSPSPLPTAPASNAAKKPESTSTTPLTTTPTAASTKPVQPETPDNTARSGGGLFGALANQSRNENSGDERQRYARHLLDEAVAKMKENPEDVWIYRNRIDKVFRDYSSLPVGNEAAKLLADLKAPEGGAWPEGFVNREVWNGINGGNVSDLTKHANFAKPASSVSKLTVLASGDTGDNYGSRIRGYLTAPYNGEYTFWIASDDDSELWLSTDESAGNKKRIANTGTFTGPQEWNKVPSQKSAPVTLQRGKRYYFEVLHKEGGGGDHVAVGWQLPNKQMERPIFSARLSSYSGN